jgi:hypothetical protein
MKYFTPELYMQFNSSNEDEAERADEAWDRAEAAYKERLAQIRDHIPTHVVRLSELCLHDALVVSRGEQVQSAGAWRYFDGPYQFPLPILWTAVAIISVALNEEIVSLIYCLSDHIAASDAPEGWRFSKHNEQWLYDEVDRINDRHDLFVHRILFSTGVTLEIPFVSVIVHRFAVPVISRAAKQSA